MGQWSEEAKKRVRERNLTRAIKRVNAGKPKSESHRAKMREAKLGTKFPEEHRAAMKATARFRWDMFYHLYEEHPDLSREEIWDLVGVYILARKYALSAKPQE